MAPSWYCPEGMIIHAVLNGGGYEKDHEESDQDRRQPREAILQAIAGKIIGEVDDLDLSWVDGDAAADEESVHRHRWIYDFFQEGPMVFQVEL